MAQGKSLNFNDWRDFSSRFDFLFPLKKEKKETRRGKNDKNINRVIKKGSGAKQGCSL